MQKVFFKTLLASFLLSVSAFSAESNLLALATGGVISAEESAAVALNDDEMKNVVAGSYVYMDKNIASPTMKQTWGYVSETYQGQNLWIIAEKYGSTLSSGYNVYLAGHTTPKNTPPTKVYRNYLYIWAPAPVVTNPTTYGILSPYLNTVLNNLSAI
ncbi:MAG: hypothetical protein PHS42_00345 [Sulfurimonas sp.]|nr:hypothetical protein [Sulfurimonas sp.]MDD3833897.1 hypothetical protein [Sulfurimonas sp.]